MAQPYEVPVKVLKSYDTITQGHSENLKLEQDGLRYWVSRMNAEDGETHRVSVEEFVNGQWTVIHRYGRV